MMKDIFLINIISPFQGLSRVLFIMLGVAQHYDMLRFQRDSCRVLPDIVVSCAFSAQHLSVYQALKGRKMLPQKIVRAHNKKINYALKGRKIIPQDIVLCT